MGIAVERVVTSPPAGQPGHGSEAALRSQPVRIVDGRVEGGYTSMYELICPSCGDHPELDYLRSRRGFSGFAGRTGLRRPWLRFTSTRGSPGRRQGEVSRSWRTGRQLAAGHSVSNRPAAGHARASLC